MRYELKKILSNRYIVFLLATTVLANAWLFWKNCSSISGASYDLRHIGEKYNWTEEELEQQNDKLKDWINQSLSDEQIPIPLGLLTGDPIVELALNRAILDRKIETREYSIYIDGMLRDIEFKIQSGIFGGEKSFSVRAQKRALQCYSRFKDVVLEDTFSGTIESITTWSLSDFFLLLFGFAPSLVLLTQEKNAGLFVLLKPMRNGRRWLFFRKLSTTTIILLLGFFLLFGLDLLIAVKYFGTGNLLRPIQTVYGFRTCPVPLTVLGFCMCFYGIKLLYCITLSALFFMLCCVIDQLPIQILSCIGLLAVMAWLAAQNSLWLRAVSMIRLAHTKEHFQSCLYLNLLQVPVDFNFISIAFCTVFLIASTVIGWLAFCRRAVVSAERKKGKSSLHRNGRTTKLAAHECYKLLICSRGLLLLLVFLLVQVLCYGSYRVRDSSFEMYYKRYSDIVSGLPSQDSTAFLTTEGARFEEIHQKIEYYHDLAGDKEDLFSVLTKDLRIELYPEEAYQAVCAQYDSLSGDQEYIYKTPYVFLFGRDGRRESLTDGIKLLAVLTIALSGYFCMEEETGVQILINTAGTSRKERRSKLLITTGLTIASTIIAFLPRFLIALNYYGLPLLYSPANSIDLFREFSSGWTIMGVLLLATACSILFSFLAVVVIMFVAKRIKNTVSTILLCGSTLLTSAIVILYLQ